MFTVEVAARCSDRNHPHGGDYTVSVTAEDRAAAEAIARHELHRQGVPTEQVDYALRHMTHYCAADIADGMRAPAFTPESGAHDFTLRILES